MKRLNVKKKSVKKQISVKKRVSTGIQNLDPLIQGGVKDGHITLVVGNAGSGKTLFALQFLWEGLRKGESCVYLTFEEKKEKLYQDIDGFGWDFAKYEKNNKFFFLEYSPEQVKTLVEEGGGTIDQIITKAKVSRVVIDSITSFSLLYPEELSRKEAGLTLFDLINNWGCTAILTSQASSQKEELYATSLEFEADNIIYLYHFKVKGERIRGIEIVKMRGTTHPNKTMKLDITKAGLIVKPKELIKI